MPRKEIEIDSEQIEALASYGCNVREMADFFKCDESTIRKRFKAEIAAGISDGKIRLRQKQFDIAMAGNVSMLIWLGKQMLGQSDRMEMDNTHDFADGDFKIEIVRTGGENGGKTKKKNGGGNGSDG